MVDTVARKASVLVALGLMASTACGGLSQRQVGDNESGAGGDGASGGNSTGGRGGNGGVGGSVGGSVYTGGVGGGVGGSVYTGGVGGGVGGSVYTGGVGGSVYTGGVGGSFPQAGTGGVGVGGSMPTGGMGTGGVPSDPYAIPWEWDGYVSPKRNIFGLEGGFYFATDCTSTAERNLPCTEGDPILSGPDGQFGWALSETVACARGKAPQVIIDPTTGVPAYELQWGALLGIAMNQQGESVFDARARGIVGFAFDLSGVAPPTLRVNVVTPETLGASHFVTVPVTPFSQNALIFGEALQGTWVVNPAALDMSRVSAIEFHVSTNSAIPTEFDFCISNLRAILQ
jgi:hypothetical protein